MRSKEKPVWRPVGAVSVRLPEKLTNLLVCSVDADGVDRPGTSFSATKIVLFSEPPPVLS
jgi:hypothetical protein